MEQVTLAPSLEAATSSQILAEKFGETKCSGTTAFAFNSSLTLEKMMQGFSLDTILTAFDRVNFSEPGRLK